MSKSEQAHQPYKGIRSSVTGRRGGMEGGIAEDARSCLFSRSLDRRKQNTHIAGRSTVMEEGYFLVEETRGEERQALELRPAFLRGCCVSERT